MDPAQLREIRKKEGKAPPRTWSKPFSISCTESIFEPYIPPEGDGRVSSIGARARQVATDLEIGGKSYMQLRKVRQYEEDFDPKVFVQKAHDILMEAQALLPKYKDTEDRLHDLVTEKAYPIMIHGLDKKTLIWKFLESVEAPRVMHVRTTAFLSDDNLYGQVTVRFYTKQILAVYDRFGRLMYGSEKHPKDVLEYVVFEKHLADELGKWRVHDKIIPEWLPRRDPVITTLLQPDRSPDTVSSSIAPAVAAVAADSGVSRPPQQQPTEAS